MGPASDPAAVTMPADNTTPTLLDALDIGDSTKVLVTFTERVSAATAQGAANYTLTPTLAVSGATLQSGNKSVLLTVAKMTLHQAYTVTVNNVKDVTGRNTIVASSTTQFTYDYRPGLKYEYFEFAGYPTSCSIMDTAKPVSTGVSDWMGLAPAHRAEKYGFRMTGAINALETGLYKFSTNTQQGSRMYIDGKLVVDNDYTVSFVEGSINLTRGKHSVMCLYYATGSTCVWESRWEGPGHSRTVFFPAVLMHNPDAPPPVAVASSSRAELPTSASLSIVTNRRAAAIRFSTPARVGVQLGVYDLRGRLVCTLIAGNVEPGSHSVAFDGRDDAGKILSRGQYLVGFHAGNVSLNRVLTLAE